MNTRNLFKLAAAVAALALPASAFAVAFPGTDTFGHSGTNNPAACVAITPGNLNIVSGDDNCVVRNIGFSFTFYGVAYTQVGVGTNGLVVMGGCGAGSTTFTNSCIPGAGTPNATVYGYWDDLLAGANQISDGVSGVAPNQIYTVNYVNVPYFSGAGTASFQVQLHQNGGPGEFVRVRITAHNSSSSYTRGIENAAGTDAIQSECNVAAPALPSCHQYSMAAAPPPGTGCDLTPVLAALAVIEGKLDTNSTRMTTLTNTVNNMNATLNNLAAAIAAQNGALCDIVRLLNTPQGQSVACGTSIVSLCGTTYSWNSESTGGTQPNPPVCP